jgi:addiction module HigA family antidote
MTRRFPVHPGEVLRNKFLRPMNLSGGAVARAVGVPRTRIERVADQKMGITADTALRVAKFFGTTPMFWLNLQVQYDLECCRDEIGVELGKIEPVQKKRNRMPPPRQGDLAPD